MTKRDYIALAEMFNLIEDSVVRLKIVTAFCKREANLSYGFDKQKFFYACNLKMEYLLIGN